jgi:hypothetical protein
MTVGRAKLVDHGVAAILRNLWLLPYVMLTERRVWLLKKGFPESVEVLLWSLLVGDISSPHQKLPQTAVFAGTEPQRAHRVFGLTGR